MAPTDIKPYTACCVQAYWESKVEGDALKQRNLEMMCTYIDAAMRGPTPARPVRLIVFPEFSIGGCYEADTTVEEVKKLQAISIPGPETHILAEKAKQYNCYIVACNPENDPLLPDYFFNTAFIISPKGKIILKYRKLNIRFGANPHDMIDKYINPVTGKYDPFPVVDTEIGRLSCFICGDINIPEIPRIHAIKGADVLIHTDGGYGSLEIAQWTLRVRARDNKIYIVNENCAALVIATTEAARGKLVPLWVDTSSGGGSCIIDYHGNYVCEADRTAIPRGNAPQLVKGLIDVMACRRHRMSTLDGPAGIRTELYAPYYNKTIFPPNKLLTEGMLASRSDPKKVKWDDEGRKNLSLLADYYSEEDIN